MLHSTTSLCVVLLSCIASAFNDDITSVVGQGGQQQGGQGADDGYGGGGGGDYGSSLQFDSNAAAPVLDPSQAGANTQAGQYGGANAALGGGQKDLASYRTQNTQGAGQSVYDSAPTQGNGGGMAPAPAPSPTSFNPMTADMNNGGGNANPMQQLLGDVTSNMHQTSNGGFSSGGFNNPNNQGTFGIQNNGQINSQVLSSDTTLVVSGLVEAFMHNVQLPDDKRQCLEQKLGEFTGDVMGTVGDVVTAVKALIAGKGTIQQGQQAPLISAGMDSAMKITSLVASTTTLAKGCVDGQALAMLKEVEQHLVNAQYLKHNFLENGVDIAHELANAIISFEGHHFRKFGHDIGVALRKILLSKGNHATRLPDGVPEEKIIQEATDGLTEGFFVSGSAIDITDTAHPDVRIHVDLHQCISGNEEFFKEIFEGLWDLIATLSSQGASALGAAFQKNGGQQPKWTGELMIAMMQFPMALSRCGVTANRQHMLMEAVKTLGDLKMHFTFPEDRIQTAQATDKMAKAVEAWTNWNFKQFGYELGKLFRELVMLAFPQKYSIDSDGLLQAIIPEEEKRVFTSPVIIIGGAAASLLVALALVRTRRSSPQQILDFQVRMTDIEDGDAIESVE